jgi:hypothetical protein
MKPHLVKSLFLSLILVLCMLVTLGNKGCDQSNQPNSNVAVVAVKKDFLWEVKRDGAAVSISINKAIKGLRVLSANEVINDNQERAALEVLDKVNEPSLAIAKTLKGVSRETWEAAKGDVLKQIDLALNALDGASSLTFSEKGRAQFQIWISSIRAGLSLFKATVEALRV